jgi:NADH-quinone oxidoreductase subunit C
MTVALSGTETAARLRESFPDSITESTRDSVFVKPEAIRKVISFLKITPGLDFDFLNSVTAVDYFDYFDVVYHLTSLKNNHSLVIKARLHGRDELSVPSIIEIYQGADYQEREVYDLIGIKFEGHPRMKRIVTFEGFEGHPLRKDYL